MSSFVKNIIRKLIGGKIWESLRRNKNKLKWKAHCYYYGKYGSLPNPMKWVFIVGCYNSGTTLLHEILASNERIGSMPWEGQFYQDQLPIPAHYGLSRLWALEPERFILSGNEKTDIDLDKLKRQWGGAFNDLSRDILIEKTPINAGRMKWLQKNFDNAYFIAIVRDGYAVSEGIRRKQGHSLADAAKQWCVSNRIMLDDLKEISNKLIITYEELSDDSNKTINKIAKFIGIEECGLLSENHEWKIHEREQPIKNMNYYSHQRLSEDDYRIIDDECESLLAELGYKKISSK